MYSTAHYAESLAEVIHAAQVSTETIEKNFLNVLRNNNDLVKLPDILLAAERRLMAYENRRQVEVVSACPLSDDIQAKITKAFSASDRLVWKVDPRLIGGIKIIIDGSRELDVTIARRLTKLFSQ